MKYTKTEIKKFLKLIEFKKARGGSGEPIYTYKGRIHRDEEFSVDLSHYKGSSINYAAFRDFTPYHNCLSLYIL